MHSVCASQQVGTSSGQQSSTAARQWSKKPWLQWLLGASSSKHSPAADAAHILKDSDEQVELPVALAAKDAVLIAAAADAVHPQVAAPSMTSSLSPENSDKLDKPQLAAEAQGQPGQHTAPAEQTGSSSAAGTASSMEPPEEGSATHHVDPETKAAAEANGFDFALHELEHRLFKLSLKDKEVNGSSDHLQAREAMYLEAEESMYGMLSPQFMQNRRVLHEEQKRRSEYKDTGMYGWMDLAGSTNVM